jgi:hypothetical protein
MYYEYPIKQVARRAKMQFQTGCATMTELMPNLGIIFVVGGDAVMRERQIAWQSSSPRSV